MTNPNRETISESDLRNSTLYSEYRAELEEINRHKWIESEKAGKDVGFEFALTDWIIKHRVKWRSQRRVQRTSA
jgi:hypothetical protein